MQLEYFTAEHLARIDLQPQQEHMRPYLCGTFVRELARGSAYTVLEGARPMMCFGFRPWSDDHGAVWSFLARDAGRHMLALSRIGQRFLSTLHGEVFALVQSGFEAGRRWIELLSFEYIGSLDEYGDARLPHEVFRHIRTVDQPRA